MLIFMLNLRFWNLQLIQDYVHGTWSGNVDYNGMWPWSFDAIIVNCLQWLHTNPFVDKPLDGGSLKLGIFGALVWIEEVAMELLRVELLFYKKIVVPNEAFNPLNWWWNKNTNSQILVFLHIRWWGLCNHRLKYKRSLAWLGSSQVWSVVILESRI
jgi:hypothetical protein